MHAFPRACYITRRETNYFLEKRRSPADKHCVEISAIALSGLDRAQASLDQTATRLARLAGPETPGDTADLSSAMVDMLAAKDEFAVNIKMLKVADQMNGQVLDILA